MIDRENPVLDLSAMDRCARCGAQALLVATHAQHGDLLFCGHHARDHRDALQEQGWVLTVDGPMAEAAGYTDKTVINV